MSTTAPVDEVEAYVAAVKERLAGVPDEERAELLDDVAAHVREVADEFGGDQLIERLGVPAQFGDELRASAGFLPFGVAVDGTPAPRVYFRRTRDLITRLHTQRVDDAWKKLEPGWWVVRGVLIGYAIFGIAGVRLDAIFGFVVLAAAGAASFVLGERRPAKQSTWARRLRITGEVVLVVFGLGVVNNAAGATTVYYDSGYSQIERDPCLRDSAGRAISNLYAFDTAGQLIPQFFLTDEKGRPIDNLCPDAQSGGRVQTTYARDVNGSQVYNVFPRAQKQMTPDALGGINLVPVTPPAVLFPQLAPPAAEAPTETPAEAPAP
jgi:hypothetical protein